MAKKKLVYSAPLVLKRATPTGVADEFGQSIHEFRGLASTWALDRQGDIIVKGAFAASVAAFKAGRLRLPILWEHDRRNALGGVATMEETDQGLEISARIATGHATGVQALALMRTGGLSLSVGFVIPEGGASVTGAGRVITKADLEEISLVTVAAQPEAVVQDVKSRLYASPASMARTLREQLGIPRRLAEGIAKSAWPSLPRADEASDDGDASEEIEDLQAELDALNAALRS